MDLDHYLHALVDRGGSDLFLSPGGPASLKVDGHVGYLDPRPLGTDEVHDMAYSAMTPEQCAAFERDWEMNLARDAGDKGRYRINIYRQRGQVAMAVRLVSSRVPSLEELNLPPILHELIMLPRGLLLFVGAAGAGKSTTMAAMIDYRNRHRSGHILSVEDPIEYLHEHRSSLVDQREVGFDTHSYADALHNAMRQAPDVLMIGEIRDRETMQAAISYAETGHLCLSTLHSNNANQTIDRILNFFPEDARAQVLVDLSLNLKAVVSQRLLPSSKAHTRRVPAVELLLASAHVSELIRKGEIHALKDAMSQAKSHGMQTFDDSLFQLVKAGLVRSADAIEMADSRTDLTLRFRLEGLTPAAADLAMAIEARAPEGRAPEARTATSGG
jgi:twitching motility protein PilU